MTLLEVIIAMCIITVVIVTSVHFIVGTQTAVMMNQDRAFAMQKALALVNELRAYAQSKEDAGGASTLDVFDDGVGTSGLLTIDSTVVDPANIVSGNSWLGTRWRYARRITIRKFPSFEATNVRIVEVKIFLTQPGDDAASVLADISSVVTTGGDMAPPKQVYDIYLLCVENIPGWWVYMAYLKPFIETALSDMESRNPGLEFRQHWITKAAYGRDQEYKPYFNDAVDSTADINYVYFYPGSMPTGSGVSQYYVPGNVNARINIDNVTANDYNAAGSDDDITDNSWPYTLADQYNHAMRYPDEWTLYQRRLSDNTEQDGVLTYRLLLDDMILNPDNYRNAIFINLHGELIPMPSIRNYSDAAKDPVTYPQWRAVAHPEKLRYGLAEDVTLRVYGYLADPTISGSDLMISPAGTSVPIRIDIPDMHLTPSDIAVTAIQGGIDQNPQDAISDTYIAVNPALTTAGTGSTVNRMYYTMDYITGTNTSVIKMYNTPLRAPKSGGGFCGLDTSRRLYGMDYIPCPVSGTDFSSRSLTYAATANSWNVRAVALGTVGAGGALASNGADYIYAFRGGATQTFWRHSISGNSWLARANYGFNVGTGGALVYVNTNGRIYGFAGNTTSTFQYYTEDAWTVRTNAPGTVGAGGALAYPGANDFIYALRGNATSTFWSYSISTDTWITMTAAPGSVGTGGIGGGALAATGDDYIYAFQGGGNTAFWRYSISGNNWVVMAPTTPYNVGAGGALVYPGSGDYIYAFQGNSSLPFLRYSISGNSWITMTAAPGTIATGGALVYSSSNDTIYGLRGNTLTTFWRCDPTPLPMNTARWLITIPAAVIDREIGNFSTVLAFQTRITNTDEAPTSGVMWPPASRTVPANLSTTYIWRNNLADEVPFSERYQFQGDPRHCPYADVKANHGYNWYFDNLRDVTNVITEWPGFDATRLNNGTSATADGWHGSGGTTGDMLEIDVPRFFQFIRTALTGSNGVWTTITGFSYYYMGLGNEIGYDSANGFPTSIPTSSKPFNGASGTRNEDSITTALSGGVKYIRENVSPYWWGMPWLGELYPDKAYTPTWTANGNLPSGSTANTYVRIRRQSITTTGAAPIAKSGTLPVGTNFYTTGTANLACVRRTNTYGCTSLFNIGTTTSTFRHRFPTGTTGSITVSGTNMANAYSFPLQTSMDINRPFSTTYNWTVVPTEFSVADYSSIRCSAEILRGLRFYGHVDGAGWEGSSLVRLQNNSLPVSPSAFLAVNGLAQTVQMGTSGIARYAVMSLLHSLLSAGVTGTPSRVVQLPRIEVKQPNVTTELENPSTITITWETQWKRWDEQKYTSEYSDTFTEVITDVRYALIYSRDNGRTWRHIIDDDIVKPEPSATAGYPTQAFWLNDTAPEGDENYTWDVADTAYFPEGNYIIRVEAYRNNQLTHYAYHEQRIYINR